MKTSEVTMRLSQLAATVSLLTVAGCSSLNSAMQPDRIDYKSASKESGRPLEIPPDLTRAPADQRYGVPGGGAGTTTLSGYQQGRAVQRQQPKDALLTPVSGMHIERDGNQRWLAISNPPQELWQQMREFWEESGFLLTIDSPETGIMETDWAENRAKIPQDFIRNTIGKVFDGLYSTGERDKFRLRVERNPQGGVDVFISHRGVQEVLVGQQKDRAVWTQRPTDPELEAEFLARLMQRLGAPVEQAQVQKANGLKPAAAGSATIAANSVSRVSGSGSAARLELNETFDRAWRQVGLALDRSNFTVEDRDRSKGLYYVRYVDPKELTNQPGLFDKLFGKSADDGKRAKRYQINVRQTGNQSLVSVLDDTGAANAGEVGQRILTLIDQQLR